MPGKVFVVLENSISDGPVVSFHSLTIRTQIRLELSVCSTYKLQSRFP